MKSVEQNTQIEESVLQQVATSFKAIGHPMRLAMIHLLRDGKKLTVTEIHNYLDLMQPVASQHLKVLKNKAIVQADREGKNIYYSLKHPYYAKILDLVMVSTIKTDLQPLNGKSIPSILGTSNGHSSMA